VTKRLMVVSMHILAVFGGIYAGFLLFDAVTK
jgi:hypothetical protein